MCCTNPNKICLLSQVVGSLAAIVAVSTLPYPVSTLLVSFGSLELVTFTTFICSVVAPNLLLAKASLVLSVILVAKSILILIVAMAIDLDLIQVGISSSSNRSSSIYTLFPVYLILCLSYPG